jgi:hypothetical protein
MKLNITLVRQHNGSLLASAVHNGRLISRVFYGYTMKQARQIFLEEIESAAYALNS